MINLNIEEKRQKKLQEIQIKLKKQLAQFPEPKFQTIFIDPELIDLVK